MSELENLPEKVVSLIPYFFYDLFGRIFPGLFLLCGSVLAVRCTNQIQEFFEQAKNALTVEWIVACMVLAAGCFVLGFLISTLSRALWRFRVPTSLAALRDQFGSDATTESAIEIAFEAHFHFKLGHETSNKTYLVNCSRLCQLAVTSRHPSLDSVSVRVDAEDLLSRSLFVASVLLLVLNASLCHWIACVAYAVLAGISLSSFFHYRKKQIRERFQMFLVLWQPRPASDSTTHP
jgi:hypothetical protein